MNLNTSKLTENSLDLSILVISCDYYSDVWPVFFKLFWKNWSDCPYPIYLGVNQGIYQDPKVTLLFTGMDINWSHNARLMLEHIPTKYLLVLLEDFFIREPIYTIHIEKCRNTLNDLNGGYLRLKPFPKPDKTVIGYPQVGLIEKGAPYRVSLQAAIWNRDILFSLLKDGESAWEFELLGSRRSDRLETAFYSTWSPIFQYEAAVTKGKWLPFSIKMGEDIGVSMDLSARRRLTHYEFLLWKLRGFRSKYLNLIPWRHRRSLGNIFKKFHFM